MTKRELVAGIDAFERDKAAVNEAPGRVRVARSGPHGDFPHTRVRVAKRFESANETAVNVAG